MTKGKNMSFEITSKVDSILAAADVPDRHTFFQMGSFILGKECTVQGQLWQVVRELRARRDSLEALTDQIADLVDNIELASIRIERLGASASTECDSLHEREVAAHLRKAARERSSLIRTMDRLKAKEKYLTEEVTYLVGAYESLAKVEAMKPLDDVEAQRKYWNEKLQEELNLRILLKQPVDSDFVRTVMSMPDDSAVKVQLAAILHGVQNRLIADRNREELAQSQKNALRSPE